ncbi:hypothetical protein PAECIP111893_03523 [Paenibacillus plantiphilus]|uniref:Bacteriophage SP-beta YorD domain-containing protein n=1 Tax=Paenibacillus plantiphilus TaxID=2905650 RepID=A0ABM9CH87_9BACL|nr:hypothetical protein [Paenibacillus plantiphilus]CAH1212342.1 hypothetical protein PAECIP111893_03523 [Paenibacillus plantiphilus]
MKYYVDFNERGSITGFYVDEIHGENIPEEAIPITVEQWQTYSGAASLYKLDEETIRLKTEQELADEAAALPPAPKSPEQQRIEQLEADNVSLMTAMADIYEQLITLQSGGAS